LLADRRARDGGGERGQRGGVVQPARGGIGEHAFDRRRLEPAPLVKSPLSSLRPAPSSACTPSGPSRSSLSIARSTVSRRAALSPPPRPIASITPSSTLRLLTLTR